MYHGVINIYKEPGFTSFDVVAKLRGILKQKKIGHTGTLDPAAEGVLPVCLGQGTRLCDMLTDKTKTYEAVLLLGQETDTEDTTGQVLKEYPVTVTEEEVRNCVRSFLGDYDQIPPMYSALKVNGKKLYELARAGKEIERQPRRVQILAISVDWVRLPEVGMTVTCSKGTYIRTLCYDIGRKLGCGGCMEHLKRTRVERFLAENSLTLKQVEEAKEQGLLEDLIIPVQDMFDGPKAVVTEAGDKPAKNGNALKRTDFACLWTEEDPSAPVPEDLKLLGELRVYAANRQFLGIYGYEKERDWWKPKKMFLQEI